jgi:hydroxysqualene dehydroxylase
LANSRKVAVIGGGYAGLAAAVELARHHVPVTLFEAAKQLGGRARRVKHQDLALDNGQHILIGAYRETLRLMQLVGINASQAFLRLPFEFDLPGRFHLKAAPLPAPLHLAWGLLTAHGLSITDRLAAIRFVHSLRQRAFKLAQDVSVATLLANYRQGQHAVRYLWEPLCIAALNTPVETASAQVFLHVLRDSLNGSREASDLLLPRIDLSTLLPDPAATFVRQQGGQIRLGTPVRAVSKAQQGYLLLTDDDQETFSEVVCAVPPSRMAKLLEPLSGLEQTLRVAKGIVYQPICTIYLQYPAHISLPRPMLGFSGGLAQWAFDRGQLHGTPGLIAVVISAEGRHLHLTHDALAQAIHQELAQVAGPLPAALWHKVITEKRATFSCTAGLVRPSHVTPMRGLYLAGDYTSGDYPATLEGAIRSGVKCAKLILETP